MHVSYKKMTLRQHPYPVPYPVSRRFSRIRFTIKPIFVSYKLKRHAPCRHSGIVCWQKTPAPSGEILIEEQDLPGIARRGNPSPALIFLPPDDVSHIPGCLDPVTSLAEDLEIIPGPLVTSHGNWPDVVQDIMMAGMRTSIGPALMDLAFAPGTPPSLFVPDKPPHSGDRRPFFEPVFHTAG